MVCGCGCLCCVYGMCEKDILFVTYTKIDTVDVDTVCVRCVRPVPFLIRNKRHQPETNESNTNNGIALIILFFQPQQITSSRQRSSSNSKTKCIPSNKTVVFVSN